MGKGKILIAIDEGKIGVHRSLENVNNSELTSVICQLDILKQELLNLYKKSIKQF